MLKQPTPKDILVYISVALYIVGAGVMVFVESNNSFSYTYMYVQLGFLIATIVLKLAIMIVWCHLTLYKFLLLQKSFLVPYTIMGVTIYLLKELNYSLQFHSFEVIFIYKAVNSILSVFACSLLMNYRFISTVEFYAYMLVLSATALQFTRNNQVGVENVDEILIEGRLTYFGFIIYGYDMTLINNQIIRMNTAKDIFIAYVAYLIAYKLVIMDILTQPYNKLREKRERRKIKALQSQQKGDNYQKDSILTQNQNQGQGQQSVQQNFSNASQLDVPFNVSFHSYMLEIVLMTFYCLMFIAATFLVYVVPIVESYNSEETEYLSSYDTYVLSGILPLVFLVLGILAKLFTIVKPSHYKNGDNGKTSQYNLQKAPALESELTESSKFGSLFSPKEFFELQFSFIVPYTVAALTCWTVFQTYKLEIEDDQSEFAKYSQGLSIAVILVSHFAISLINSTKTISKLEFYAFSITLFVANLLLTFETLRIIFIENREIDEQRLPLWNSILTNDIEIVDDKLAEIQGMLIFKDFEMFQVACMIAGLLIELDFLGRRKDEKQEQEEHQRRIDQKRKRLLQIELKELESTPHDSERNRNDSHKLIQKLNSDQKTKLLQH